MEQLPKTFSETAVSYQRGMRVNLAQFIHQAIQVAFVGLVIGMERNVLPAVAQRDFGVVPGSYFFLASFVVSFGVLKGALNFVAGNLADSLGRRPVLLAGWLAAIPLPFLIFYARNWDWIVAANVFLGLNQAFAWTMTVTSKIDITRFEERGFATGVNECAGYVAVGIGALCTGYLAARFGARHALAYFGFFTALLGLTHAFLFVKETLFWARAEHGEQHPGSPLANAAQVPTSVSGNPSAREIFVLVSFGHPTFRALCQAGIANKIADALLWALYPVFLHQRGVGVVAIGWITGIYAATWGLSQLWTGHLSDRVGRKPTIVSGLWILALGVAGSALSTGVALWILWAVLMGVGMALLYPNLIAAIADISGPSWRGKSLGTYRYWRDTGYAIGAAGLGALAQWQGEILPAFFAAAALLVLSGLWVSVAARETHPGMKRPHTL